MVISLCRFGMRKMPIGFGKEVLGHWEGRILEVRDGRRA